VANLGFQGPAELTLDVKGRIAMPALHRDVLAAQGATKLTITKSPHGCLLVFAPAAWEEFAARVMALPMDAIGWRRLFLGNAIEVELDGSSRMLIAPALREYAGLTREVFMLGMGSCLEVWDRERYRAQEAKTCAEAAPASLNGLHF
jgi:MraZ protein